jgi:PEP-CTERM motif
MPHTHARVALLAVALAISGTVVHAQPSLTAFAGVVAGPGGGSGPGCGGSYGMPPGLEFFPPSFPFVNAGGVGPCGYSGGYSSNVGTAGPITNSRSVSAIPLDLIPSPVRYAGTANATATYGSLGASATASTTGDVTSNPSALFSSMSAAMFTDRLTATSPLIAQFSNGFVRYQFSINGSLSVPGVPAAYFFGETYVSFAVQQDAQPIYEVMNATVRRGGLPTITNREPPVGWTSGIGSLTGGSVFSILLPMSWGTQWQLQAGLLSFAYGSAETNFIGTAKLTGVQLYDANQREVTDFTLTSQSGTDYRNIGQTPPPNTTVPEPSSAALLLFGGIALAGLARRRRPGKTVARSR